MALEQAIWGYTDTADLVTVPVFIFTVHRGATLLGALEPSGRMVGFAYAVMGMKDRRPMQWSHMAGVLPEFRGGLGYRLKLAQRERALSQGLDLIEWTFDPLQAMNAHFNFAKLGCVADEYAVNFYGESTSALHRGTPTDRLVASWRIAEAHVVRRLEQSTALRARSHDVSAAPIVNPTGLDGQWRKVTSIDLSLDDRRVGSRSRPGSPRCSSRRQTARCNGAWICGRCSRRILRGLSRRGFCVAERDGFRQVFVGQVPLPGTPAD